MAGEPRSGHARADSAIEEMDAIPKALVTARNFCTAVTTFTSQDGFKALNEVLDLLPRREEELKARDDTIRDLQDKLAEEKESNHTRAGQQFAEFEARYKSWDGEKSALEMKANRLQEVSDRKNEGLTALREELEKTKSKVEALERDNIQKDATLQDVNRQVTKSEERLQEMQAAVNSHLAKLEQSRNDTTALKQSLEDGKRSYQILEEKASRTQKSLDDLSQYSADMKKLNLSETVNKIEDLWQSAIQLVVDFAGRELSQDVLRIDWNKFRQNDIFKDRIPLPQSNSDISKMMRVAIVLGTLAKLIDKYVFQPTYLLEARSGLREVLYHQARIDPAKERFTRGILLSMSSDVQEAESEEEEEEDVVGLVVDKLLNNAIVQVLIAAESISDFETKLDQLVMRFQDEWRIVQHGKQKLDTSFDYTHSTDHPWQVLDMPTRNPRDEQSNKAPFHTSALEEDNTVIVPRVCYIRPENDPTPKTRGCVLRRIHLDAAEEEARKDLGNAQFARAPSDRQRRRRSFRTPTVTSHAPSSSSGSKGDRLFSRARGALGV